MQSLLNKYVFYRILENKQNVMKTLHVKRRELRPTDATPPSVPVITVNLFSCDLIEIGLVAAMKKCTGSAIYCTKFVL